MSPRVWGEPIDLSFKAGVIVKHWNGTLIDRVVAANADREAGSNPAARCAQGLSALTIRWLGQSLPPEEDWVEISYLPEHDTEPKSIRFQWKVFQRCRGKGGAAAATAISCARRKNIGALGIDVKGEAERQIRRYLFKAARKQAPQLAKKVYGSPSGRSMCFRQLAMRGLSPESLRTSESQRSMWRAKKSILTNSFALSQSSPKRA